MGVAFFSNLKGDAFGGITAGIVALPLALAFGVSSGLGPSAGLYGAIFIGFFAALFGGTNTQISGPTAPMTAVSMIVIAGIVAANNGDLNKALPAILTVFLMAGIIQVILGFSRLGIYVKYIPYPVVSGFMTAIGVIILITQLLPALGYYPKEDTGFVDTFRPKAQELLLENILKEEAEKGGLVIEDFEESITRARALTEEDRLREARSLAANEASGVLGTLKVLPRALRDINWLELILTLTTIFIIYGFKRITTIIPSALVALVAVSAVAYGFNLNYRPIEQIPEGIPMPNLAIFSEFSFTQIEPYILTALTLALLGAIDSLLTSVVADNMTKTKHSPNKELIGQGIGNSFAALFGGLPGAGATIRTVVNINAGGKTKLSGMIAGLFLLVVLLALGPIASQIPAAVLAGILVTVGIGVMDYKGLKAIPNMPKGEVFIMFLVLFLATFWNLVFAVGLGLVVAALLFMKNMGDLTSKRSLVSSLAESNLVKDELDLPEEFKKKIVIKQVNGPLFFGATNEFQALAETIPKNATWVIMKLRRMEYMDQSGLYVMENLLTELRNRKVTVVFVSLHEQPKYMMESIKIIPNLVSQKYIFDTLLSFTNWLKENYNLEKTEG
ncbi:SulP family inorganic anion transporter [Arenibacter sp. GZD96]|uniref:SulP family inorganic anion transporter n=1 Tax=Aurantibrevibacter litoralis TaxID=3106030 RepID=UPI002AFFF206|nr:SulP family inorganic anion transporter [Arenibacter sp. GZD-96]MEA1785682.1 SulP family inorganic anion transporter [Arenibacter sp. GZD-96]